MEFQRSDYPALLATLQPTQAVQVLNSRVEHVSRLNQEVADWLQERRRIEEIYVQGLKRLAKKTPPDGSSELGVFAGPWTKIVGAADELADSHHILAQRIEADVEKPLRKFTSQNREYQSMSNVQGHLNALANDIGNAQDKADKLKRKGERASPNKVAGASTSVGDATSEFSNQAPFVFEQLQALDESRLNHLRDVLTQFQTHEVDQVERERVIAESTLNSVLNVETADEIKTWAERIKSGGLPTLHAKDRLVRRTMMPSFTPSSPPIPDESEDNHSLRSGVTEPKPVQRVKSNQVEEPKKSHGLAGGLKRLGTRIGRRKDRQPLADQETPAKPSKSRFGDFNRSSSALPPLPPPPSHPVPMSETRQTTSSSGLSLTNGDAFERPLDREPQTNGLQMEPFSPEPVERVDNVNSDARPSVGQATSPPAEFVQKPLSPDPSAPKSSSSFTTEDPVPRASSSSRFSQRSSTALVPEDETSSQAALQSVQNALRSQQLAPPLRQGPPRGRRSIYGGIPPQLPTPPANALSSFAEEPPTVPVAQIEPVSESASPPLNHDSVDAIFSSNIPASTASSFPPEIPKKMPESPSIISESRNAASMSSSTLSPQILNPLASPPAPPPPRNSVPATDTNKNIDPVSSIFTAPIPAATSSFPQLSATPPVADPASPMPGFLSAAAIAPSIAPPQSDTASIHSSHSMHSISSLGSVAPRHPDLGNYPGLSCSIIETMNCTFTVKGQVETFDSHGEIACAYQPESEGPSSQSCQIKISGRHHVDKVIPNPTLLNATADTNTLNDEAIYSLQLASLSRQPLVALKYNLRPSPNNSSVPLLLRPAWKIEAKTAGIILHYSLNPAYIQNYPSPSLTFKNLVLVAGITSDDPIPAISCQSKPAGTFSRERGLVYWRLGDVSLSTVETGVGHKVVARFMLQGESAARPGTVEARFEMPVPLLSEEQQGQLGTERQQGVGLMECEAGAVADVKGKGKAKEGDGAGALEKDPFADEDEPDGTSTPTPARMRGGDWKVVRGVKKVVSGRYVVVNE